MTLVVDAGAMYAAADAADPRHDAVRRVFETVSEPLVTSEFAVAEADYLILDRLGPDAEAAYLADLVEGGYVVECLDQSGLARAREVVNRYRDLQIGLADASIVVLAGRNRTTRLLTFDERAFRAVTPLTGGHFTLLPADA